MISTPGPLELLLILGLALLLLGPARLPDAARSAGKAVRDFREALSGGDDPVDEFAAGDDDDALVDAGPAAEAEYREHVAEDEDAGEQDDAAESAAQAGPAGEAEYRERKSGSGTEAGDPAPPPVS